MSTTTTSPRSRPARRWTLDLFRHYDDPPGVDSRALPSEVALRPIEPHYQMRR